METVAPEVLEGLKELDTATLFNAVIEARGASQGGKELEDKGGIPRSRRMGCPGQTGGHALRGIHHQAPLGLLHWSISAGWPCRRTSA